MHFYTESSQVRHVTHEVRTPLNTVAIGADVLKHEVKQLGDLIPPVMMELVVGIKEASAGELIIQHRTTIFCPALIYLVLHCLHRPVLFCPFLTAHILSGDIDLSVFVHTFPL